MCGIIAVYYKEPTLRPETTRHVIERMQHTLTRRGPDERGIAEIGPCWLGHTRLSIIDLSSGTQPVYNEDGTVAVVLNGEIYNYPELRRQLRRSGHVFRTSSDTEVIVHLYEDHGPQFLEHLNGMFAIALYDRRSDRLILARDRMGEKPVLYCDTPTCLVAASELKALVEHPAVTPEIDPDALALYLNASYIPAPYSVFKSVRKLPPAHYLQIEGRSVSIVQYWRPRLRTETRWSESDIHERFVEIFRDAVRMRMVADVPLGVFLSGGIDSSAVAAFMSTGGDPVRTFTVGFGSDIDERPYARMVAERYRTEHTEINLDTPFEDGVDEIFDYMDEPFADSSIVPTFVVAREARKHVKVILTGDGGDELFAGYSAYLTQQSRRSGRLSSKMSEVAYSWLQRTQASAVLDACYPTRRFTFARTSWLFMRSMFTEPEIAALMPSPSAKFPRAFFDREPWLPIEGQDPLSVAFEIDTNYYLPDDLLKKVDMASMCASLECRAPFLDHRLVEFAFSIPPLFKVRRGSPKHVLKGALAPYLPAEVLYRPKHGFGAPVPAWIRQTLRDAVHDALAPGALIEEFVGRRSIANLLKRCYATFHADDAVAFRVWSLYVLERWMRAYGRVAIASRQIA